METKEGQEQGQEIVEKFIAGSARIDRMRKEINQFVGTVKGLCDPCWHRWDISRKKTTFIASDIRYIWEIYTARRKMVIRVQYRGGGYPFEEVIYSTEGKEIPHEHVQKVHDALGVLFTGMDKLVNLSFRLKPFLAAAEAAEKR